MDGLLVIDKPVGPTSHDVVARVRRILGEQRVGHTGTLDPGASGVLPLVVGRATRLARFLSAAGKSYDAVDPARRGDRHGRQRRNAGGTGVPRTVPGAGVDRSRARRVPRDLPAAAARLLGEKDWRQAQSSAGARGLAHSAAFRRSRPSCPSSPPSARERHGVCAGAGRRRWRPCHAPCRLLRRLLCARARARSGRAAGDRRASRGVEAGAVRRLDARRCDGPRGARARSAGGPGRARPAGADAAGAHGADADPRRRPAGGARARPRPGGFRRRARRLRFRPAVRGRSVCSTRRAI